jgi:hypothetical protein
MDRLTELVIDCGDAALVMEFAHKTKLGLRAQPISVIQSTRWFGPVEGK